MLPPETLELVLSHLERGELARTLSASAQVHDVGARVLYRALIDVPARHTPRLLATLARNGHYAALVRRFDLEWTGNILTANFLRLLRGALARLTRLVHLGLEFSSTDSAAGIAWILSGCRSPLRVFTTSMRCEPLLARFFEDQPGLVEICLRGAPALVPSPLGVTRTGFPLSPGALPRLAHFRTVLAAPHITADFVRGRPVESVSMSLYPGDTLSSLDALLLSTRPLRRLTVMSFDAAPPSVLLTEISTRLPALEALHTVVLLRQSSHELLVETAPSLSRFKALRYLTFMAPGALSSEDEGEIAALWHAACPTLRTIILPKGVVWGNVDGRWLSLQDAS